MNIGLFQLENLLYSQVQFCFLDVRDNPRPVAKELEQVLARSINVKAAGVKEYLQKTLPTPAAPVILLSEDGSQAGSLRKSLESVGYTNIYVVEGGVEGLLSEL